MIGGHDASDAYLNQILEYDPADKSWKEWTLKLTTARRSPNAALIQGSLVECGPT